MKFAKITLSVALLGALTLGMAEDTATVETTTSVSVDTQIAEIQAAPAQERVRLMNQFKQRLAAMNEEQRAEAIAQLQEKIQTRTQTQTRAGDAATKPEDATQAMTQTRTRTQEMIQDKQMQANEQMTQMQNMNQMQVGSQFNHMNTQGTVAPGSMNFMNR